MKIGIRTLIQLSSREKRGLYFFLLLPLTLVGALKIYFHLQQVMPSSSEVFAAPPAPAPVRPKILGIAGVRILTTNLPEAREFYGRFFRGDTKLLAEEPCIWCERIPAVRFVLGVNQTIEVDAIHDPVPANLLAEITFLTDNLGNLKRYFKNNKIDFVEVKDGYTPQRISVSAPEGHRISFMQSTKDLQSVPAVPRILHAGIIVRDRAAEDRFYKDILGFHVYWQGGIKDGETTWVNMQVPYGTDWIEYMLNVPADADRPTLAANNHIALGVPDIHATEKQLLKNGVKLTEEPRIGRGGKWMLNLYDPDGTRVEFMEFTPVQKPCCSEYTGPHPGQKP
jgi:catechol 2,3-dioxygenase-like lactoylglutathione lyase family enzyme